MPTGAFESLFLELVRSDGDPEAIPDATLLRLDLTRVQARDFARFLKALTTSLQSPTGANASQRTYMEWLAVFDGIRETEDR